jgi:phosphopantothenoylcysteine decarboxylase/phosphopantothenate--cysteine ligase
MKNEVHCLISAGPTREWLDPVRFISNPSSGKMGYALANAAKARGFRVTLVSGPVTLPCPSEVERITVNTAVEMNEVMGQHFPASSLTIMSAAVCDHRPKVFHEQKIKKDKVSEAIELVPNPDILLDLGKHKRMDQILVGFAAETENHIAHAKIKLQQKNLDWIAVNDVSGSQGFEADENELTLISNDEQSIIFEKEDKISLAKKILDLVYP